MSEHEIFEVQCGQCESVFQIDATQAGTTVHCPHCETAAEIPSLAEMVGEDASDQEAVVATPQATAADKSTKTKPPVPRKQGQRKQANPQRATKDSQNSPTKEARGKVKPATAKSSARLLLKMPGMFYLLASFVGVAWSVKVIGTLYPIVNSSRGGYGAWMIEATMTTALSAALIGLLIAVAELIVVVVHLHESIMAADD